MQMNESENLPIDSAVIPDPLTESVNPPEVAEPKMLHVSIAGDVHSGKTTLAAVLGEQLSKLGYNVTVEANEGGVEDRLREIRESDNRLGFLADANNPTHVVVHDLNEAAPVYSEDPRLLRSDFIGLPPETDISRSVGKLIQVLSTDREYLWSWYCNLAMAVKDSGAPYRFASEAAARFLSQLTGGGANVESDPRYEEARTNHLRHEGMGNFGWDELATGLEKARQDILSEAQTSATAVPESEVTALHPATETASVSDTVDEAIVPISSADRIDVSKLPVVEGRIPDDLKATLVDQLRNGSYSRSGQKALASEVGDAGPYSFSAALSYLRQSDTADGIFRDGWNGRRLYVRLIKDSPDNLITGPFLVLETFNDKNELERRNSWVPSTTDVLADDWRIYHATLKS